jgi:UDP-N-acetylmuramate dehydrogenase
MAQKENMTKGNVRFRSQLAALVKGEILEREPLSKHTSFDIGGPADFFIRPRTEEEMVAVVRLTRACSLPLMVIGRGTNLLVADGGVRGVVLDLSLTCRQLEVCSGGVSVGAGVSVQELLDFCLRRELGGLEFMAGIPGSVGGAIRVNAGAWGKSIGELVDVVRGYDLSGQAIAMESSQLHFRYRGSNLTEDVIITEAELVLSPAPSQVIQKQMKEFQRRRLSQPLDQKSAGSVFKNPPRATAGKLIEESGCKGLRIGGAEVSLKHANFIINCGGATAAEVKELIERVRGRVKGRFGVELETEILAVGEE